MENDYKPPPRRRTGIAFLFAGLGLFLLNIAVSLLKSTKASGPGWVCLVGGLALILVAGLWAAGKI